MKIYSNKNIPIKANNDRHYDPNNGNLIITISLSTSDLERIKDTLGTIDYDDIHTAIVDAFAEKLDALEDF